MSSTVKYYLSLSIVIFISAAVFGQKRSFVLPKNLLKESYSQTEIIVKLKEDKGLNHKQAKGQKRVFGRYSESSNKHPLKNIFKIVVDTEDLEATINSFLLDDNVIYAEPYYLHEPFYIPNDPEANPSNGLQSYLNNIRAYDAWTVERGDSTIVVGILDSGIDTDHPEFLSQIAYNPNDPINGIDDDGDGLVDNYAGWDLADNDNNPEADTDNHGTLVAGVSSAQADNGIGIAGTGFNSSVLPIKIFKSGSNLFSGGYEAIVLAANLGCKVINLSWGVAGAYSGFGQDVIDYVVNEKDVVVVAAAGNTDELLNFYPASYSGVLSVASSELTDEKASFSTYGYYVDLMAPGRAIYTTDNDNLFNDDSGTSLSAPQVAGAAALVRARYPNLNALQVMEKLRVSADDVYHIGSNDTYQDLLGKGRLNMLEALVDNSSPALRVESFTVSTGVNNEIYGDDTLKLDVVLKNYLQSMNSGTARMVSLSPYVDVINDTWSLGRFETLETADNKSNPFILKTTTDLPPDQEIVLKLQFESGSYKDYQYIILNSSPNYTVAIGGDLQMTISADGNIAYDEQFFQNGNGIIYNNAKVLDNIGLMLAFNPDSVADNAPVNFSAGFSDTDFKLFNNLKRFTNGTLPTDIRSAFTIGNSIRVEQRTLSNNTDEFIIQQYRMINRSAEPIPEFFVTMLADWDIGNSNMNMAGWIPEHKLGYIHDGNTYLGIALLTDQDSIYSAIDNLNFNGNAADIPFNITDSVKFSHSSRGIFNTEAGSANGGNDVSHVIGGTIDGLAAYLTEKIAFAFVAGLSLEELIANNNLALEAYNDYQTLPPLLETFNTCINEPAVINPSTGNNYEFYTDVNLSNLVYSGDEFVTDPISSPQSFYIVNTDSMFNGDVSRVIVKPKLVNAGFTSNPEVLLLDETGTNSVQFSDTSIDAVGWNWDFGNGISSINPNPVVAYSNVGFYDVTLEVTSDIGCTERITQTFEVANRSNLPDLSDLQVCANDRISLDPTNATEIEIYTDAELNNKVFTGTTFSGRFQKDTTLFIITIDSTYSSNVKEVNIDIAEIEAEFVSHPDTTDLSSPTLIRLTSQSELAVTNGWFINGGPIGPGASVNYDYSGLSQFEAMLISENMEGCKDSTSVMIQVNTSTTPELSIIEFCASDDVSIEPSGAYNIFYRDEQLSQIVAKGSSLDFENLTSDTIIYVTNVDEFGESTPAKIDIIMSDIKALFAADPEVLNIKYDETTVNFINQSIEADGYVWTLDGDTISMDANASIMFDQVGDYQIALSARNDLGCIDDYQMIYQVVNITSAERPERVLIYPMPAQDILHIQAHESHKYKIHDLNGRLMKAGTITDSQISLMDISSGVYILTLSIKNSFIRQKIVID